MGATQTAWIVFLACAVPALLSMFAGVALLAQRGLALKKRVDAYKSLPVVARIDAANAAIAAASPGIALAPALIARTQSAVADLADARARLVADLATVGRAFAAVRSRFGSR